MQDDNPLTLCLFFDLNRVLINNPLLSVHKSHFHAQRMGKNEGGSIRLINCILPLEFITINPAAVSFAQHDIL